MVQTAGKGLSSHDWYDLDNAEALVLTTSVSSASSPEGSAYVDDFETLRINYAGSASGDKLKVTAPFKFTLVDWAVQGQAAVANGTVTLLDEDGNSIEALACAAVDTITRSSSPDLDHVEIAKGEVFEVQCNSDGVTGILTLKIRPE